MFEHLGRWAGDGSPTSATVRNKKDLLHGVFSCHQVETLIAKTCFTPCMFLERYCISIFDDQDKIVLAHIHILAQVFV